MRRLVALVTQVVVLAMLGGCSFVAVRGPAPNRPACTSSRWAPAADTVVAIGALAAAIAGIVGATVIDPGEKETKELAGAAGLSALVFGLSAVYGFTTTGECRSVKKRAATGSARVDHIERERIERERVERERVEREQARMERGPTERVVVADSRPVYCTNSSKNRDIGACSLDEAACNDLRQALVNGAEDSYSECQAAPGAACFNANNVIDGSRRAFCFPSISYCETHLTDAKRNPDLTVTATQCGVYRVEPRDTSIDL